MQTNTNDDAIMSKKITDNLILIDSINQEYYSAKQNLERAYRKKFSPYESFIYQTEQKYSDLACLIAEEAGACPVSRWGSDLPPNKVYVKPEGIQLMWEDSHPYHSSTYHYFTASWEQLFQGETNEHN